MAAAGGGPGLDSLAVEGIGCIDLEGGRRIGSGVGIGCIGRRRSRLDLGNRTWYDLVVLEQCGWQWIVRNKQLKIIGSSVGRRGKFAVL